MLVSNSFVFPYFKNLTSLLPNNLKYFRLRKDMHFYSGRDLLEIIFYLKRIIISIGWNLKNSDSSGRQEP